MALIEDFHTEDLHPIDIVELLAEQHEWEFDRIEEDQIAMAVEAQWKTYSITLAWSGYDQTLRMVCSFEMDPPADTMGETYRLLNQVNDKCWGGAFTFWEETRLMVYRYALILDEDALPTPDQINTIIGSAVLHAERFYPAFQLVAWGGRTAEESLDVAIAEAYGRA